MPGDRFLHFMVPGHNSYWNSRGIAGGHILRIADPDRSMRTNIHGGIGRNAVPDQVSISIIEEYDNNGGL